MKLLHDDFVNNISELLLALQYKSPVFAPGTAPYPQQPVYQPMPNDTAPGNQQSPQNPSAPR